MTEETPRGPRVGIKGPLLFSAFFGIVAFFGVLIFASGGAAAVPLILRELERSIDHWFWALGAITGANPIVEEHRGRLGLIA